VTATGTDVRETVSALRDACASTAAQFGEDHGDTIERYRSLLSDGIDNALAQLRADVSEASGANEVVETVADQLSSYVSWMQWSLWDLPVLAVALDPNDDDFRDAVSACGLVYLAIRAFDDVIDEHYAYKGRRETLLGTVSDTYSQARRARALTTLAGLLLCFDGLRRLALARPDARTTTAVLGSLERAVVGALMEYTRRGAWSQDEYVRMVRLKNVDYWRVLYAALDIERESPLLGFFERYYEVAQYLNDVGDFDEDVTRGQPNLLALTRDGDGSCRPIDERRPSAVTDEVEAMLAEHLIALAEHAAELPPLERAVAETKLLDLLDQAVELGLFAHATDDAEEPKTNGGVELYAFSELSDVVDELGAQALVEVDCVACGSPARNELFRKQGFRFHRCASCGHVYVSPRISDDLHAAAASSPLATYGRHDKYLDVQRIYAEHICDLLRRRTAGPRLLDVGFGRGYVMQMAQVYGFEAYGIDASPALAEPMRQLFGHRVATGVLGRDPIPWSGFDVVVLSHVLEHLPQPLDALRELAAVLNPGGWLYVAVPDVGSIDFRIFGKQWDVFSPLVHLQYFTEGSLRRLVEAAGFVDVQRIRHPELRDEVSPRWMRLMRQLGGTASSEVILVGSLPDPDAPVTVMEGSS
jgi:SAM-dependent methyltransferase/uncharacterized protein YbjQ (UPF0145 family)